MTMRTISLALCVAAVGLATACGSSGHAGSPSQRPATSLAIYANANQIVQALKAHHVLVTNVVADSGFWSGEGATSGVWVTTAPGDSAAVFGGSENPVQDTEIVVFQNHAEAVAYANLSTNPTDTPDDPDHETILGTNWAVDAATPAASSIRAALGGTLIPNVPASGASASPQPAPPSASPTQAPATAPPVARVLFSMSGNGIYTGPPFNVGSQPLTVSYSYDCSSFGQSGNFIADLLNGNQSQLGSDDQPIANQLGMSGSQTVTVYPQNPGADYYLSVNSECDWSVTIKGY